MTILWPILLAGATLSGPAPGAVSSSIELTAVPTRQMTLSAAAAAAARREPLTVDRAQFQRRVAQGRVGGRRGGRPSVATRATAIFAGAILGSLAGMVGGALIDVAANNLECMTGAAYGTVVGGGVGAVLTARWVH